MTETQTRYQAGQNNVVGINDDLVLPGVDRLERYLEEGAIIEFDGVYWCLYAADGMVIASGRRVKELIINLVLEDR